MQLHKREQQEQVRELAGVVLLGPELLEPEQVLPGQVLEQSELVQQEPAPLVMEQLELEQ